MAPRRNADGGKGRSYVQDVMYGYSPPVDTGVSKKRRISKCGKGGAYDQLSFSLRPPIRSISIDWNRVPPVSFS
jgi:hypothetical protein